MARTSQPPTRASGLPAEPARAGVRHAQVVSLAPGRLRVRLHRHHRDPSALAQVQQQLTQCDGVAAVATNHRTGSVLVRYDHRAVSKDDVIGMLYDLGVVVRDVLGAEAVPEDLGREEFGPEAVPHSSTASGLLDALTDLDRRVSRLTGGRLDVKLLVPASLGLIALRQILTNGLGLAQVPGYVLVWYTFDSFYKLHQRHAQRAAEAGSPAPTV